MARYNSYSAARHVASENSLYYDHPYVVFRDTSGVWNCEPYDPSLACHREAELVHPRVKVPVRDSILESQRQLCQVRADQLMEQIKKSRQP